MIENEMSEFKNSNETDKGKTSNFVVKMNAPIGPKQADLEMTHTFTNEENNSNKVLVNEITHKTFNYPYADYFDIIHR